MSDMGEGGEEGARSEKWEARSKAVSSMEAEWPQKAATIQNTS